MKRKQQQQQRSIEHRDFGTLSHVVADLWQRQVQLRFFGQTLTVPLYVDIANTATGPEPQQVAAYQAFNGGSSGK